MSLTISAVHRELRPYARAAMAKGWTLGRGGNHVMLVSPAGKRVPLPSGNLGPRAVLNTRAQLRGYGVEIP